MEEILRLSGGAAKALENIRGQKNETIGETVSRTIASIEFIKAEMAKGSKIVIERSDGSKVQIKDL